MKKKSILKLSAALIALALAIAGLHNIKDYSNPKDAVLTAQESHKPSASRGSSSAPAQAEKPDVAAKIAGTKASPNPPPASSDSSSIAATITADVSALEPYNSSQSNIIREDDSASSDGLEELGTQLAELPSEILDVEYKHVSGKSLLLDIYRPTGDFPGQKSPAIVYIHGGGWIYGSKNGAEFKALKPYFDSLRERGFTVFSINYRLASSGGIFPAPVEDCRDALRWLSQNSDKYNINENNIGLWGSSSGAHLAMMCAYSPESGQVSDQEFYAEVPSVRYVVDFFGPATFSGEEIPSSHFVKKLMGSYYSDKSMLEKASPITYVTRSSPPTLIVHGEADSLVPLSQSELLYSAFKENGVPSELIIIPGAEHTLLNASSDDLDLLFNDVIGFIETSAHE